MIKTLIGEGRKIIGCSGRLITDSLKWKVKPERRGRKQKTTIQMDGKNGQNDKDSANDQLNQR